MGVIMFPSIYVMVVHAGPSYGAPITTKYYSTAVGTGVAADGQAGYANGGNPGELWSIVRSHAGSTGSSTGNSLTTSLTAAWVSPNFWGIMRSLANFDTRLLPLNCLINSAKVVVVLNTKLDTPGWTPSLALVKNTSLNPTTVVAADYQKVGATPIAPVITWPNIVGTMTFQIDVAYFTSIISNGITQLGFREYKYDCLNVSPPWARYQGCQVLIWSRDASDASFYPYLEVTYQPKL